MSDHQKLEPLSEGFIRGILGIGLDDSIEEAREELKRETELLRESEPG